MRNVFWRKEVLFMARWMERLTIAGVFVTLVLARVLCGLRSCSAGFAESIPGVPARNHGGTRLASLPAAHCERLPNVSALGEILVRV